MLDETTNTLNRIGKDVLDKGFVVLVDRMGDDSSIVQAARVSYGEGTKTVREDRGLIRYLMRHAHTTPFEMVQLKWHVKLPIFVARQWMRHRTGSFNEISGRYSEMKDEFYVPKELHAQATNNRQGRQEEMTLHYAEADIQEQANSGYALYRRMLDAGVSREEARIVLPLSLYTEFYWSVNLHNFLHFHRLRADSHAQWEIQQYAEAMGDIVARLLPLTWEAYLEYQVNGRSFSKNELDYIKMWILRGEAPSKDAFASNREYLEFFEKLGLPR